MQTATNVHQATCIRRNEHVCVGFLSAPQGLGDTARTFYVVLLDKDRVVEAGAVIRSAAAADRVFLGVAQPGQGFARIEQYRPRTVNGRDESRRRRCSGLR